MFLRNDGGRAVAGYKGTTGDCGVRAIAIGTGKSYGEVYYALQAIQDVFHRKHEHKRKLKARQRYVRNGVWKEVADEYLTSLGWRWIALASIGGEVVRVQDVARLYPNSIMRLARHFSAMVDGVNHDTWEQMPVKRVYGVWVKNDG
jgi:hypothetical protein